MKTNKFADLIKHGLSVKSLMKLSESDINKLHILYEGKKEVCPKCKKGKCECKEVKKKMETNEKEEKMIKQTTYDPKNAVDRNELASKGYKVDPLSGKVQLNQGKEEDGEEIEPKEEKNNPWAICTDSVGRKDKKKYERCVQDIKKKNQKKKIKENNSNFERLLENRILYLLEKHTKPSMKKGELMNLISKKKLNLPIGKLGSLSPVTEEETETKEAFMNAPATEPTTKPTTAPTEKPKPFDPFSPDPSKKPAPKAKRKLPTWLTFNNLGIKFKK